MDNEPTEFATDVPEPMEVEKRGYNPPPVMKVERPTPSPPAPRPSSSAPRDDRQSDTAADDGRS